MTYDEFRKGVLSLEGVTYVGPESNPNVGVENDLAARKIHQIIDLSIPMRVTGPIIVVGEKKEVE